MTCVPKLRKRANRAGGYSWKLCPYSTTSPSNRVPTIEKTIHYTTSGYMRMDIHGGHNDVGWVCLDLNCAFYKGTAVTEIVMSVRNQKVNPTTGEYTVESINMPIPICSGTYFWEK